MSGWNWGSDFVQGYGITSDIVRKAQNDEWTRGLQVGSGKVLSRAAQILAENQGAVGADGKPVAPITTGQLFNQLVKEGFDPAHIGQAFTQAEAMYKGNTADLKRNSYMKSADTMPAEGSSPSAFGQWYTKSRMGAGDAPDMSGVLLAAPSYQQKDTNLGNKVQTTTFDTHKGADQPGGINNPTVTTKDLTKVGEMKVGSKGFVYEYSPQGVRTVATYDDPEYRAAVQEAKKNNEWLRYEGNYKSLLDKHTEWVKNNPDADEWDSPHYNMLLSMEKSMERIQPGSSGGYAHSKIYSPDALDNYLQKRVWESLGKVNSRGDRNKQFDDLIAPGSKFNQNVVQMLLVKHKGDRLAAAQEYDNIVKSVKTEINKW
ncbi:hypothetical protein [Anaeroselena agilis]|uniref:Uncharacterized protein n=1 Tax=Anaeroselena agilis TaxID=3063788 RepID=A0ABU3NVX0_9FIRM|nr:hypothetical protein [Selenomonadales bacterium 4137-cl]